ncbi:MAG: ATP synthase F1 subunit delta [Myxococcota bacterium]
MTEGSIARRYAKALLEIAREENQVDKIGEDLVRFARLVETTPLGGVVANPSFTREERRAVLERVIPGSALHPRTVTFLKLLLDKDRFGAVADIAREYRALADAELGRVRATVTTAADLTPSNREQIVAALSHATGKKVVLETKVDPTLLGGIVARVGDKVFDASLRTRLERLQLALTNPSQA